MTSPTAQQYEQAIEEAQSVFTKAPAETMITRQQAKWLKVRAQQLAAAGDQRDREEENG